MQKVKPEYELARRIKGHSQIERVQAARAILHSTIGNEGLALLAFMAIFHPEYPDGKVRELVRDVRDRR